jgi:hypothetical protein
MATEKVSLTLDREVVDAARARVGKRGLSSYVNAALRLKLGHDRMLTFLKEMDEEYGPVDEQTAAEVGREWNEATARLRRARRKS